jgi:hypothetical protein
MFVPLSMLLGSNTYALARTPNSLRPALAAMAPRQADSLLVGLQVQLVPAVRRQLVHHVRAGERTDQAWEGETAGFYYVVVDAMLRPGFTSDEIGKIGGGNFLRVFADAIKK